MVGELRPIAVFQVGFTVSMQFTDPLVQKKTWQWPIQLFIGKIIYGLM